MSSETGLEAKKPRVRVPPDSLGGRATFRLYRLLYLVVYWALVCWLGVKSGLLLACVVLGLTFALVVGLVLVSSRRRSSQQEALLWALAIAAERGMPLAPTFEAFAGQSWGRYRRKALAAARDLTQGFSLPEVLHRVPRLFPREAEVLIHVGSEAGVLPATLHECSRTGAHSLIRGPWFAVAIRIGYLTWVLILLEVQSGFISYFIAPKFQAIFADFGIPLPAITAFTIGATQNLIVLWPLFLIILCFQLGILILVLATSVGVFPWDLPLLARFFLRHHSATILRSLARVVEGTKPLDQGFQTLARIYPVESIRKRLVWVGRDVQDGGDWCAALVRAGLVRPAEAVLLESARRAGNLAWALRVAAENSERRFAYRLQWTAQCLLPLLVIAVGAVVFLLIVSYFTPIVLLIQRLAP